MLHEHETNVISITPIARGIVRPILVTLIMISAVIAGAHFVHLVHQHASLLALILVGPCLVLVLTRLWRWRSHKIHVTTERVMLEGGVARHTRTAIDLRDVVATEVDQRLFERLTRRGRVDLVTRTGTLSLGRVRHPAALSRLIDRERLRHVNEPLPLATVFDYETAPRHEYEITPRRRWRRGG